MVIYENVERIRTARGITKSHMAKKLKMSLMGYVHISNGDVRLDAERLKVIGDILSVDPSVFFDDVLTDSVVTEIESKCTHA